MLCCRGHITITHVNRITYNDSIKTTTVTLHQFFIFLHRKCGYSVRVIVFNTTFNNMSAISWRSVLLVEETGVP